MPHVIIKLWPGKPEKRKFVLGINDRHGIPVAFDGTEPPDRPAVLLKLSSVEHRAKTFSGCATKWRGPDPKKPS